MDCTGLVNCTCPRCFGRAVDHLREAESVTRQLRETAIRLIAIKWGMAERTVTQALRAESPTGRFNRNEPEMQNIPGNPFL